MATAREPGFRDHALESLLYSDSIRRSVIGHLSPEDQIALSSTCHALYGSHDSFTQEDRREALSSYHAKRYVLTSKPHDEAYRPPVLLLNGKVYDACETRDPKRTTVVLGAGGEAWLKHLDERRLFPEDDSPHLVKTVCWNATTLEINADVETAWMQLQIEDQGNHRDGHLFLTTLSRYFRNVKRLVYVNSKDTPAAWLDYWWAEQQDLQNGGSGYHWPGPTHITYPSVEYIRKTRPSVKRMFKNDYRFRGAKTIELSRITMEAGQLAEDAFRKAMHELFDRLPGEAIKLERVVLPKPVFDAVCDAHKDEDDELDGFVYHVSPKYDVRVVSSRPYSAKKK